MYIPALAKLEISRTIVMVGIRTNMHVSKDLAKFRCPQPSFLQLGLELSIRRWFCGWRILVRESLSVQHTHFSVPGDDSVISPELSNDKSMGLQNEHTGDAVGEDELNNVFNPPRTSTPINVILVFLAAVRMLLHPIHLQDLLRVLQRWVFAFYHCKLYLTRDRL